MRTGLAHWGTGRRLLWGWGEAGEKPAGADSPWPHVPGCEPTSLMVLLHVKEPLVPSLTFAPLLGSGSDPSPQAPLAVPSQETSGSRQQFSPLQDGASGLAPPSRSAPAGPATRHLSPAHVDPLLPLLVRLWQALSPEALCSLIRKQAAGGLWSQSERFIVVFRGRLGAM